MRTRSDTSEDLEEFSIDIEVLNEELRMCGAENTNDLYTFFHDYSPV